MGFAIVQTAKKELVAHLVFLLILKTNIYWKNMVRSIVILYTMLNKITIKSVSFAVIAAQHYIGQYPRAQN